MGFRKGQHWRILVIIWVVLATASCTASSRMEPAKVPEPGDLQEVSLPAAWLSHAIEAIYPAPDGRRLAIRLIRREGGEALAWLDLASSDHALHPMKVAAATWHPDGSALAVLSGGAEDPQIVIVDWTVDPVVKSTYPLPEREWRYPHWISPESLDHWGTVQGGEVEWALLLVADPERSPEFVLFRPQSGEISSLDSTGTLLLWAYQDPRIPDRIRDPWIDVGEMLPLYLVDAERGRVQLRLPNPGGSPLPLLELSSEETMLVVRAEAHGGWLGVLEDRQDGRRLRLQGVPWSRKAYEGSEDEWTLDANGAVDFALGRSGTWVALLVANRDSAEDLVSVYRRGQGRFGEWSFPSVRHIVSTGDILWIAHENSITRMVIEIETKR